MNTVFLDELVKRKKYLGSVISEKEKALKKAPKGRLRCTHVRSQIHYYWRKEAGDKHGRKDLDFAKALAQKDYDEKVLRLASEEEKQISKILACYEKGCAENLVETMPTCRRELIIPICLSDNEYIEKWQKLKYERKGFGKDVPEFFTAKGEQVRSKSEVLIADLLGRMNIPYHYEMPLRIRGAGIVYPDFTVLNVRTRKSFYWEHLGMMDDISYAEKALEKINAYMQDGHFTGDDLILTHETRQHPIRMKLIQSIIEHYLL